MTSSASKMEHRVERDARSCRACKEFAEEYFGNLICSQAQIHVFCFCHCQMRHVTSCTTSQFHQDSHHGQETYMEGIEDMLLHFLFALHRDRGSRDGCLKI